MKYLILLFVFFGIVGVSGAQDFYVPVEFNSFSQIKVELNSPLSLAELNSGFNAKDSSKLASGLADAYEEYNLIGYRLMNHELIDGFLKYKHNVLMQYSSDIASSTDTCRYIVKSGFDFGTGIPSYYLFDTQTKQSYKHFSSVEKLLNVLDFTLKFKPTPTMLARKSKQELLDEAIFRKFFKERKKIGTSGKYIFGGLALAIFETLGIVLSNLE